MPEDGWTKEILNYVAGVAEYFKSQLGPSLVDVYKMGSFAHGGFSQIYSDIDVGVILNSPNPPEGMDRLISGAKGLDPVYGKRLSVFWGNPACRWGRLRILDRLDLLDHGIPLLNNRRAKFERPTRDEIRQTLLEFVENGWKPKTTELSRLSKLNPAGRKPYVKCLLYPARLIYTWDCLKINSNDRAVEYLREVRPPGLDLHPIEFALECRHDRFTPEEIFAEKVDLNDQFNKTISYLSKR
ncbi:MAG: nucleotidyltransferase domain-containing protein [Deltaproteobacteria bacterium]|nr:nucleotidyltransferase domain-containing protein [Deltaproteobacteria bacterium]